MQAAAESSRFFSTADEKIGALPRFRLRQAYGAIRQLPDEADSVGNRRALPGTRWTQL
jgi:hypothetical protein